MLTSEELLRLSRSASEDEQEQMYAAYFHAALSLDWHQQTTMCLTPSIWQKKK